MFTRANKGSRHTGAPTVVGADTTFAGDIISNAAVHVDGHVTGDIKCQTLMIGAAGSVAGAIVAEEAEIFGSLRGKLQSKAVFLAKTARIVGDISHQSLEVQAGAQVEGRWSRFEDMAAAEEQKEAVPTMLSAPVAAAFPRPVLGTGPALGHKQGGKRPNGQMHESLDEEVPSQAS